MPNVLRSRITTYQQEAWKAAHDEAMKCRDLEELIDVGVGYFNAVKNDVRRWKDHISTGAIEFREQEARDFVELYRTIKSAFDSLGDSVENLERSRYVVDGAKALREAREEVTCILSVSLDDVMESVRELNQGKVRPLREVMDELRGGNHSQGCA